MGLPQWRVQIQKSTGGEEWSNDYLTDILLIAEAATFAQSLLTFERNIHGVHVNFDYIRISSYVPNDRTFRHIAVNQLGLQPNTAALPLYCTARLDMQTSDSDPCRKYFRMPVREDMQDNGIILPATVTSLNSLFTQHVPAATVMGRIVSNKGNTVISGAFYPRVQMRQLHRRKRPKMTAAQFANQ